MGQLDQFAKDIFASETEIVTDSAASYVAPSEIGLSEVRLDGMLRVLDPARLAALAPPWSLAPPHDEIVLEVKMQGDHLDPHAESRTLLRRLARQIQRMEDAQVPWDGEAPVWMVTSRVPTFLSQRRRLDRCAPGCYRVDTGTGFFDYLWIAANELPLREELIPFLIARSGKALDELGLWLITRRPPTWLLHMVECLPMSTSINDELLRYFSEKTDDPERLRRRTYIVQRFADFLGITDDWIDKGLAPLIHQCERRVGRTLRPEERQALHERLLRLGSDRLGDVVLDLTPEALAAWLADPDAR